LTGALLSLPPPPPHAESVRAAIAQQSDFIFIFLVFSDRCASNRLRILINIFGGYIYHKLIEEIGFAVARVVPVRLSNLSPVSAAVPPVRFHECVAELDKKGALS
jgi:hypothetical protein